MSYTKQTWDTTSYVNPTRMNHIEDGIKENSDNINGPAFTEAATRANINSDESLFTILGKIKKFFTDLKAVAFSGAASDVKMSDGVTSVESAINNIFHIESVSVADHAIVANDGGFAVNCPVVSGKTPVFARYKTTTGYNVVFATTPLYRSSTDAWIVSLYSIYNQSITTRGAVEIYYL